METLFDYSKKAKRPWLTHYNETDQSMELSFTEEMSESYFDTYLASLEAMVNLVPVKSLLINDININDTSLGFDWKIIELTWEPIYKNGGEKIIVVHKSKLPGYVKRTYCKAMEDHGVPIKLEFRPI